MQEIDFHASTYKTLSEALLNLRLIDLIIFHYPQTELQVRVLESPLMNETTLADLVIDPKAVWREMLLTPGVGEKARRELSKAVCHALARAFPQEWEACVVCNTDGDGHRLPGLTRQLGAVQTIWKITEPQQGHARKVMYFSTRRVRKGFG